MLIKSEFNFVSYTRFGVEIHTTPICQLIPRRLKLPESIKLGNEVFAIYKLLKILLIGLRRKDYC